MSDKRYYYITDEDYATAKANGIGRRTLYSRVNRYGYDIDRAITEPVIPQRNYKKHLAIARKNGISDNTFYKRIDQTDMTPEEAATKPVMTQLEAAMHARESKPKKFTAEQIAIAQSNGISMKLLWDRTNPKRRNWSIDRAIHTPPMSQKQRKEMLSQQNNYFRQQLQGTFNEKQA